MPVVLAVLCGANLIGGMYMVTNAQTAEQHQAGLSLLALSLPLGALALSDHVQQSRKQTS